MGIIDALRLGVVMWDDNRRTQRAIDRYRANLYREMDRARSARGAYLRSLAGFAWRRLFGLGRDSGRISGLAPVHASD